MQEEEENKKLKEVPKDKTPPKLFKHHLIGPKHRQGTHGHCHREAKPGREGGGGGEVIRTLFLYNIEKIQIFIVIFFPF